MTSSDKKRLGHGGKIKPGWLSWAGLSWLTLQNCIALIVFYMVVGMFFGYLEPMPGSARPSGLLSICLLGVALASMVATVGIYRNRWTGYLLELLVFITVIVAIFLVKLPDVPTQTRGGASDLPYRLEIQAASNIFFAISLLWYLASMTYRLYRAERTFRGQEEGKT